MSKPLYMHTIDGKPAVFDERPPAQICFARHIERKHLRKSLQEIRREQKASMSSRGSMGWDGFEYGYMLVYLD